jgi:hypothetical protein
MTSQIGDYIGGISQKVIMYKTEKVSQWLEKLDNREKIEQKNKNQPSISFVIGSSQN